MKRTIEMEIQGQIQFDFHTDQTTHRDSPHEAVPLPEPVGETRSTCRSTTRKGRPCPIEPRPNGYCHVHDPDGKAQINIRARAAGRAALAKPKPKPRPQPKQKKPRPPGPQPCYFICCLTDDTITNPQPHRP
jgi:hypothetical protein